MNMYITSINKNSGKTVISAGIAAVMQSLGYNAGVYKPVQTGAIDKGKFLISPDLTFVKMLDPYITTHCTYMMKEKVIPVISGVKEKNKIDLQEIKRDYLKLEKKTDILIVEAPGGLMSPICDGVYSYHIPLLLKIPVVFVVNPSIDAVEQYLSGVYCAKSLGLDVTGVIINKFPVYSELEEIKSFPSIIEKYCDIKILGLIRNFKGKTVKANTLINEILNGIDLEDALRMKIPKLNIY